MKASSPVPQESLPFIQIEDPVSTAIVIVAAIIIVAFFSNSEASLISHNKVRLHHLAEEGNAPVCAGRPLDARRGPLRAMIPPREKAFRSLAPAGAGTRAAPRGQRPRPRSHARRVPIRACVASTVTATVCNYLIERSKEGDAQPPVVWG
jgi:hypothetical protein